MKTKLEMAHDYAMAQMVKDELHTDLAKRAWDYADAMQAEADKRECKERTDVLLTKDKDGNCLHFHHEFGHKKCMDCGASLEEWQPDWSQAPDWANWWAVDKNGQGIWYNLEPRRDQSTVEWVIDFSSGSDFSYKISPDFNYQGDWRNSLRKRFE